MNLTPPRVIPWATFHNIAASATNRIGCRSTKGRNWNLTLSRSRVSKGSLDYEVLLRFRKLSQARNLVSLELSIGENKERRSHVVAG
jgi:hypothetical protein